VNCNFAKIAVIYFLLKCIKCLHECCEFLCIAELHFILLVYATRSWSIVTDDLQHLWNVPNTEYISVVSANRSCVRIIRFGDSSSWYRTSHARHLVPHFISIIYKRSGYGVVRRCARQHNSTPIPILDEGEVLTTGRAPAMYIYHQRSMYRHLII